MFKEFKDEKLDIIVLAGQSNAEGQGRGEVSKEYEVSDKILYMNDDNNSHFIKDGDNYKLVLKEPLTSYIEIAKVDEDKLGKRVCLAHTFATHYKNEVLKEGRKVLILNAAIGGTGFSRNEWGVNSTLYPRLKKMINDVLQLNSENRVVAFLWHQGEHDAFERAEWGVEKRYTVHRQNLLEMMQDFYSIYGKNIPFIAGGFCDEWYLKNKDACDAVLKAIKEVCQELNGIFVPTNGLKSNNQATNNKDDIHFCAESQNMLGNMYYKAYKKIINSKDN